MRCNRLKPIFGKFQILCGVLIVSVILGINAISSVEAVTEIGPGDRILFLGDQWVANRTASQTGFEVIRMTSDRSKSHMKYVRDTLNLKLMIGLGHNVIPDDRLVDGARPWPGDTMDAALSAFRDSLANWLGTYSLDISAFHFNMEYAEKFYTDRYPDSTRRVQALTDTMTLIVKGYQRTIHEVCDSLDIVGSYPKLWVFSAKGTNYQNYEGFGCDWNALTSGDYPIDVATISFQTPTVSMVPEENNPTPGVRRWIPNLENLKLHASGGKREIDSVRDSTNGKPVVIQYHHRGDLPFRNVYHLYWNDFRDLARHFKAASEEGSSHFGGNYPVGYYPSFYYATITTPVNATNLHFTQDISGPAPTGAIPWPNGQTYPARLWEEGREGDWGYNATTNYHNKWEREFIANILSATGTPLRGHTVPATTTWSGEIYLIGDVVIPSGVTVTIRAGTVINFRPDTDVYESGLDTNISEIIVQNGGTLNANGTIQNPIIFQSSFRADGTDPSGEGWKGIRVVNGDTLDILYNPGKDDWGGIRVDEGGSLTLQHCEIYDAEVGVDVEQSTSIITTIDIAETDFIGNYTGVKLDYQNQGLEVSLDNVLFHDNMNGLDISSYSSGENETDLVNATIAGNYYGISVVSSGSSDHGFTVKNTIIDNNSFGINADYRESPAVTVKYSDFYANSIALHGDLSDWSVPPSGSDHPGNHDYDPSFVDADGDDFHLQATSQLIDEGDPSMTEADNSTINMGRYGGTTEYTSVSSGDGTSSTKPTVLKTEEAPLVFSLSQNAPNPFNPETIISYSLPQSEQVKLVIYNVLGQQIRTLVNAFKPAGRYRVVWNSKDDFGRSVSSGIYFYQITAGEFLDTRKMLILK
ncbi:MAG: T9SS type A sorting domain-containing protein [Gemmatimonadetes bacterium]|nr:T9SS type A sorting domain-containing protein [Gemmatimonadota bacterium]MYF16409.1 T9SS type A sorting domain-containing protein [Gemmatimonadota bacterium]